MKMEKGYHYSSEFKLKMLSFLPKQLPFLYNTKKARKNCFCRDLQGTNALVEGVSSLQVCCFNHLNIIY